MESILPKMKIETLGKEKCLGNNREGLRNPMDFLAQRFQSEPTLG